MPKKHHKAQFSKPASSVHPSLSSTSRNGASSTPRGSANTVNDLINHLRRSQAPFAADRPLDHLNTPTVHPSLRAIFQVPETPPPRPRPGMPPSRRTRGPAGPPPPRSWLMDSIHAPAGPHKKQGSPRETELPVPQRLDRLPGLRLPDEGTLLHLTFKALAQNWHWHVAYDQHYLASLPIRYKAVLLSYIAVYNNHNHGGIGALGLETLFLDDTELEDATGSDSLTHLDLSCSISTPSSFKHLATYMTKTTTPASAPPSASDTYNDSVPSPSPSDSSVLDDWETSSDASPTIARSLTHPRFPALTHLSLSHPPSTPPPPWRQLLSLTPHLATLTHLSLAHWPLPTFTPNATTATTTSPTGKLPYGARNFYSAHDGDWKEAAGILKRLSKATYCLKWLDLEGCGEWIAALAWEDEDGGGGGGVDWNGAWRGVEVVRVGQGWTPGGLERLPDTWGGVSLRRGAGAGTAHGEGGAGGGGVVGRTSGSMAELRKHFKNKELMRWVVVEREIAGVEKAVGKKRMKAEGEKKMIVFEKG